MQPTIGGCPAKYWQSLGCCRGRHSLQVGGPVAQHTRQVMQQNCILVGLSFLSNPVGLCRCIATVCLEQQQKGTGYVAHPAVTDNSMQLGPMTGVLQGGAAAARQGTTRVVAGLSAFHARCACDSITAICAASCPSLQTARKQTQRYFKKMGLCRAYPKRGAAWAALERAPMSVDGSISSSHWLGSHTGSSALTIKGLQVLHKLLGAANILLPLDICRCYALLSVYEFLCIWCVSIAGQGSQPGSYAGSVCIGSSCSPGCRAAALRYRVASQSGQDCTTPFRIPLFHETAAAA